eukprot:COSAG02_NODE_47418_length_341_cov_0.830579_2_plen_41_part_01
MIIVDLLVVLFIVHLDGNWFSPAPLHAESSTAPRGGAYVSS